MHKVVRGEAKSIQLNTLEFNELRNQLKTYSDTIGCSPKQMIPKLNEYWESYTLLKKNSLDGSTRISSKVYYNNRRNDLISSIDELKRCISEKSNKEHSKQLSENEINKLQEIKTVQNALSNEIKKQTKYDSLISIRQDTLVEKNNARNESLEAQKVLLEDQKAILNTQNEILIYKSSFLAIGISSKTFYSAGVYSELGKLYKTWKWRFIGGVHALIKNETLTGAKASIGFSHPLILAKEERSSFKNSKIVLGFSPSVVFLDNEFKESIFSPEIIIVRNTLGVGYHWSKNVGHEFKILFAFQ